MEEKVLTFPRPHGGAPPRVGRVRPDGAIVYQGRTYATIRDVPPDWIALRPDVDTWKQWLCLYRAIDPRRRQRRPRR
jgi:hypothetical protein